MIDKKYVLPRTQLWDQSIFNIRPLSLMYYCYYYYYFQMGRELRALPWDVRNETLWHTPSMPAWKRETFQRLMGPATCTPFLPSSGHSLCFAFSRAFSAAGPRHCGLWEEWYSAFVRREQISQACFVSQTLSLIDRAALQSTLPSKQSVHVCFYLLKFLFFFLSF